MMSTLIYRCPHCGATHEIEEALVGDRIDCRKCGKPFEASVPTARPVESGDAESAHPAYRVKAGEGEIEDKILELHPTMFRAHPFRLVGLAAIALVGLAAGFAALIGAVSLPGGIPPLVPLIAGLVFAVVAGTYLLVWWLQTRYTTLTVTNRRTTLRRGLLSRDTTEVRHRDVRNLQVDQSTLQRLLGIGGIAISSSGQDDLEIVAKGLPHPEKIAAVIRDMQ